MPRKSQHGFHIDKACLNLLEFSEGIKQAHEQGGNSADLTHFNFPKLLARSLIKGSKIK